MSQNELAHAAWDSLSGRHSGLSERHANILRYGPEVSPMVGLPPHSDSWSWSDLAHLIGPNGRAAVSVADELTPPHGWSVPFKSAGVQLVDTGVRPAPSAEAIELGIEDVPEMMDLVQRTEPGPFLRRTIELGRYLGVRREGKLVAMAGERLRPTGWTEISSVCTDAEFRGQGLASSLILALAAEIHERGERSFLYSKIDAPAMKLYGSLGFVVRAEVILLILQAPGE